MGLRPAFTIDTGRSQEAQDAHKSGGALLGIFQGAQKSAPRLMSALSPQGRIPGRLQLIATKPRNQTVGSVVSTLSSEILYEKRGVPQRLPEFQPLASLAPLTYHKSCGRKLGFWQGLG